MSFKRKGKQKYRELRLIELSQYEAAMRAVLLKSQLSRVR
jgi:hypothetical protein